jgi:2-keto-3-deoxy-L-fuconate dehydrogenase
MFRLDHRTAVITGAGSGIGKSIAELFAEQGAFVFLLDIDEGAGQSAVAEISKAGGKAAFKTCNVSELPRVKKVMDEIRLESGSIDILVNNAGVGHIGNAENTKPEDLQRLVRVNILGVYHCLHEVLPAMKEKGGCILNMASVAATVGIPDRFAYSMTKGAVLGMTLSVAKDYVSQQIRCNSISPGRVHTPFIDGYLAKNYPGKEKEMFEKLAKTQPIGRMANPSEIAFLALYLCSAEASFITGTDYPIDGGFIRLNN